MHIHDENPFIKLAESLDADRPVIFTDVRLTPRNFWHIAIFPRTKVPEVCRTLDKIIDRARRNGYKDFIIVTNQFIIEAEVTSCEPKKWPREVWEG